MSEPVDHPPLFVAEIGLNHNGDVELAKKLIETAKRCGAGAVKFQCYRTDMLYSRPGITRLLKEDGEKLIQIFKQAELGEAQFTELAAHARKTGIPFFATPFDIEAVLFLESLGVPYYKVASPDITHIRLLRAIAATAKPVFVSTGGANGDEIARAVKVLNEEGSGAVTLLHCVSVYPCPAEHINLRSILWLKENFRAAVGLSDHTEGIEAPLAAVAMGATVIEKHFTLDREMDGPDHAFSLPPTVFQRMVEEGMRVHKMLGAPGKPISYQERKSVGAGRRGLYFKKAAKAGDFLTMEHLVPLRPDIGIAVDMMDMVIGKRLKVDKRPFEPLRKLDLE